MRSSQPNVLSTSTLMGDSVVNRHEESLGDIKDFVIDLDRGCVAYAVLSFGGFLGMGDKLFAVPFDALEVDTANRRVILDVDRERLESSPGFDRDNWPSHSDHSFLDQVYGHYGYGTYHDYHENRMGRRRDERMGGTGTSARSGGTMIGRRHDDDAGISTAPMPTAGMDTRQFGENLSRGGMTGSPASSPQNVRVGPGRESFADGSRMRADSGSGMSRDLSGTTLGSRHTDDDRRRDDEDSETYEDRQRRAREGTMLDVVDEKRRGV